MFASLTFREREAARVRRRLTGFDAVVTSVLTGEIQTVLSAGYLRGADCWHVAVALSYAPARDLTFFSLDKAQRAVAARLGFAI